MLRSLRSFIHLHLRDNTQYVFWVILLSYCTIFLFNQTNKTLVGAMLVTGWLLWRKLKSIDMTVYIVYLMNSAFGVGKTYQIELIPAEAIRSQYFPQGKLAQMTIGIWDICIFLIIFLVIRALYHKTLDLYWSRQLILLWGYSIMGLISALVASRRPELSIIWAIQSFSLPIIVMFTSHLAKQKGFYPIILSALAAFVLFESLVAGGQFVHQGYLGSSVELTGYISAGTSVDEDVFTFRPLGTLSHPNILAQTMMFFIFVFLCLLYTKRTPIPRSTIAVTVLASCITFILTQGRSAWISFVLMLLPMVYILEKKWHLKLKLSLSGRAIVLGICAFVIVGLLTIPGRLGKLMYSFEEEAGASSRMLLIEEWGQLVVRYPLLGVGPGMSVVEGFYQNTTGILRSFPEAVHNVYLLIAAERGIIGLSIFFLLIATMVLKLRKYLNHGLQENRVLALGVLVGSLSMYVNFNFQPYAGTILFVILFFIIITETTI